MEQITSGLEFALIVVVVGAAAIGAAIKFVLIEYRGVKEVWDHVSNGRHSSRSSPP
jgi:hypothetical protein